MHRPNRIRGSELRTLTSSSCYAHYESTHYECDIKKCSILLHLMDSSFRPWRSYVAIRIKVRPPLVQMKPLPIRQPRSRQVTGLDRPLLAWTNWELGGIRMPSARRSAPAIVLRADPIDVHAARRAKRLNELQRIDDWCMMAPKWKRFSVLACLVLLHSVAATFLSLLAVKK
jgi:hypothetical protein